MSTIPQWSGREVRALREARRMSVREFAAHLGVSDRMVSKWEAGGDATRPRAFNQAALDTSLKIASLEVRARFNQLAAGRSVHFEQSGPRDGARHVVRHPVDGKLMTLIEAGAYAPSIPHLEAGWLRAYYIDVNPTTSADYARFVASTGHRSPGQWPNGRYSEALADSLVHVPWVDAQAYARWASKSLPTMPQWDRAAHGDEGIMAGHLAEWCVSPEGPRRFEPDGAAPSSQTGFRCALDALDMLSLLAI